MPSDENTLLCEQGSAEWFAARLGHLTSSRIAEAVRKRKRKSANGAGDDELQCRIDLRLELAVERVTQQISQHYVSRWMEQGKEREPGARFAYEQRMDVETEQVGFVRHPVIELAGCSPDGFVGTDGMVEFKCPKSTTHAEYLLAECVPELYIPQMMWQMACCGRKWNEFVSYCPEFPEPLDLFICRLPRDDQRIAEMEAEARKFLEEVDTMATRLRDGLAGVLQKSVRKLSLVPRAVIPPLGVSNG